MTEYTLEWCYFVACADEMGAFDKQFKANIQANSDDEAKTIAKEAMSAKLAELRTTYHDAEDPQVYITMTGCKLTKIVEVPM